VGDFVDKKLRKSVAQFKPKAPVMPSPQVGEKTNLIPGEKVFFYASEFHHPVFIISC
jgi:hypothetical protein